MARPTLRIGIQPQTTMWAVVLGGVCYYQWYTERYNRDEEALEEHIKKTYLRNAQEAQAKMPQLAATIRGQSTSLDGNMDKLVWGGKAKLKHKGGNASNGTEAGLTVTETDESEEDGTNTNNEEEPKTTRKRKKKKRKKDKRTEEERRTKELQEQQKSLILKSSIAGVAVGAVAVAAVSVFLGGAGGTSGRK